MSTHYLYLTKKIKSLSYILLVAFICSSSLLQAQLAEPTPKPVPTPLTEQFCQKFKKINKEVRHYESPLSEKLLTCSYFQDLWLSFMHNAESVEEYHNGMQLFEEHTDGFRNLCHYITSVFNFYTGDFHTPTPQMVDVTFQGENVVGFFNTFKVGRDLTPEERETYFAQEEANYLRDALVTPFVLDASTLPTLQEKTIYNFALLPDGTIRVALEQPGNKEYHVKDDETVEEAFHYPNHTIIAGSPHQIVITAGSFILYRFENKQLFFTSCKSGHYQPSYNSLVHMNKQLAQLGIHPSTIISTPTVDMSQSILKKYTNTQIPLAITLKDTENLFRLAQDNWEKTYQQIDKDVLYALSQGDMGVLNTEVIAALNRQREESTYMRSAFNLFTENHAAPRIFHKLVKSFGQLKDAIKHNVPAKIQAKAEKVLEKLQAYEQEAGIYDQQIADDESFYHYIKDHIASMEELTIHNQLIVDDYHLLKKKSRELAALFHYLSLSLKLKEKGYFIYHNASDAFFEINEKMAKAHDDYIAKLLHEEIGKDEDFTIELAPKIAEELRGYLKQIGVLPIHYPLEVDADGGWWMINSAKEWYLSHTNYLFKNYTNTKEPILRTLLQQIVNGDTPRTSFVNELEQLHCLKRDAEIARNALIFLDIQHEAPEEVHHYIKSITHIIHAIKNETLDKVKDEAYFMLKVKRTPTLALAEWQCTDPDSFDDTLNLHLNSLLPFTQSEWISKALAEEALEKAQAIQDLMNLYRRNRLARNKDLPLVCYESLEEHAEAFVKEMQAVLQNSMEDEADILSTPSMGFHAKFMLSRITQCCGLLQE
ncbi:MAG: hypothetical protein CK425_09255 [Parachlamydia sp.]|nr:MAG: hypothetical protein CK425_09255 [Parachlamydia sp.]